MRGRLAAVRLLLESGANVNAASKHGWTPLMAAAWEGDASVVGRLEPWGQSAPTKLAAAKAAGAPRRQPTAS